MYLMESKRAIVGLLVFASIILSLSIASATWTDNGQAVQNVSDCGTLNTTGATYTINQSITASGRCVTIIANNTILNGNGFTISGDGTFEGIFVEGYNNITLKNLNMTNFESAIYIYLTTNSIIQNCSARNSQYGIYSDLSNNNNLNGNYVFNNSVGGFYITGSNETISNNIAVANEKGIRFTLSSAVNNTVRNNNLSGNNVGIYLGSSSGNNNIIGGISNGDNMGLEIVSSTSNRIYNLTINASIGDAIEVYQIGATSKNNNFTNISILNSNAANYDIRFLSSSINGTTLIDNTFGKYSFAMGGTLIIKNSLFGQLKFNDEVSAYGSSFASEVIISNNSAYVNSSNAGFNKKADVSLFGLSTGYTYPQIKRNGGACPSSICSNQTSLNAGNVLFNITAGGNYSIGEDVEPLVTINSPTTQTYSSSSYTINITLNEEGYCLYSLDGGVTNSTLTNNSANTEFTKSMSGISNGNYVLNAYCNDSTRGNRNDSVSVSFAISVSTDTGHHGGGGGGGSSIVSTWVKEIKMNDSELNLGQTLKIMKNKYRISFNVSGMGHSVGILNMTNKTVSIIVNSTPQYATLTVGESKKFDVDSNGYYDILVGLVSIVNGDATLSFQKINEAVNPTSTPSTNPDNTNTNTPTTQPSGDNNPPTNTGLDGSKKGSTVIYWVIGAVILVILIIMIASRKKKSK